MKKLLIALAICLAFIGCKAKEAVAQDPVVEEPVVVEEPAAKPFEIDLGISGDIFYLLGSDGDEDTEAREGEFVEGVSLKVANIYGELVSVNVVAADMLSDDRDMLVGGGVSVNLPTLVKEVFKGQWVASLINPSVGFVGLVDLNNKTDVIPALHLQVIRYDF